VVAVNVSGRLAPREGGRPVAGADPGARDAVDPPLDPVVDVRDAFCLYPLPDGAVAALRGLTLRVGQGERVLVHGPNGSGKTTLLAVLAGRQRLSAGRAVVAGMDVGSAPGSARRRLADVGWVDQHAARTLRPELDVLDNVALQLRLSGVPVRVARSRAQEVLDRLGVGALAVRSVAALSGGEAQRVAVCAALAHRPRLVLADEPTGELDVASADQVYDALTEAVRSVGAALVLVSHDPRAARAADRVVRIRDGRLSETWSPADAADGTPRELLVIDDRGWLRLPEAIRRAAGLREVVQVHGEDRAVVISATGCPADGPGGGRAEAGEAAAPPVRPAGPDHPGLPARAGHPLVAELRGVRKAYRGRPVLAGVDLDVHSGRLVVVQGRSGAGKSTLLRVLLGLERPDAGLVRLAGHDLSGLGRTQLAALRRQVAAVAGQDAHLAETVDAAANLELARAVRGLPADPDGDRRWLADLGLGSVAARQVRLLSGGERARVAVARALAVGPALLVLDEPTAQLDESSAEELTAVLRRAAAASGVAVVVASHDPVLVGAADQVLEVDAVSADDQPRSTTTGA
jgi:ABC-type lipoprotein export system ATPase subunit